MSSRISNAPHRVMLFDSGAGGLSIAQELLRRDDCPELTCVMDYGGFPYGRLSETELLARLCERIPPLVNALQPDLIVLACNSASTIALPALREQIKQPIVGVVPAIKPAARLSKSKVIGLLATPGTVTRNYTRELIQTHAEDCQVILAGSDSLASLTEQTLRGEAVSDAEWSQSLNGLLKHPLAEQLDTVVLGCTHFPLVSEQIQRVLPGVRLIDSGEAIARRVRQLLPTQPGVDATLNHRALLLDHPSPEKNLVPYLQQMGIQRWEHLN